MPLTTNIRASRTSDTPPALDDAAGLLLLSNSAENDAADPPVDVPAYRIASYIPDDDAKVEDLDEFCKNISIKDDVFVSEESIHPLRNKKKNCPMTRI